jgi:hypothetical protein
MKTLFISLSTSAVTALLALGLTGCGGQTRGKADAEVRAATPAEGGATSTAGAAGSSKNFGDTRTREVVEESSPAGGSMVGTGSTGGPGARESKEVTIQTDLPPSP